jgi:thioesterase domain-containing protein
MLATEVEEYLHVHIPLSKDMEVTVISVDVDAVTLHAPLEPNINHRETVFGGSASALAILAAWSLLYVRLRAERIEARLVIQRNTMEYNKPILGGFTAKSSLEQPEAWPRFTRMLARKGVARIAVMSVLEHAGQVVGWLSGEFVALSEKAPN